MSSTCFSRANSNNICHSRLLHMQEQEQGDDCRGHQTPTRNSGVVKATDGRRWSALARPCGVVIESRQQIAVLSHACPQPDLIIIRLRALTRLDELMSSLLSTHICIAAVPSRHNLGASECPDRHSSTLRHGHQDVRTAPIICIAALAQLRTLPEKENEVRQEGSMHHLYGCRRAMRAHTTAATAAGSQWQQRQASAGWRPPSTPGAARNSHD